MFLALVIPGRIDNSQIALIFYSVSVYPDFLSSCTSSIELYMPRLSVFSLQYVTECNFLVLPLCRYNRWFNYCLYLHHTELKYISSAGNIPISLNVLFVHANNLEFLFFYSIEITLTGPYAKITILGRMLNF